MHPRTYLRVEGLAVLVAASAAYFAVLDGPAWLFVVLLLAPDVSMLGYLGGPRLGAATYNLVHIYVGPLGLGGLGLVAVVPLAVELAPIWAVHIGLDRALGYGLKLESGFGDTHLSQPVPDLPTGEPAEA